LSADLYGIIIFAQTLVLYFNVLIDYGFSLSATRDISINRSDKVKLLEIYSSVMSIKAFLFLISLISFLIIIFCFNNFHDYKEIYYITFISVIGQALFPIWYFQGTEDMKYITIINATTKSLFTGLTFVFVRSEADYLYVPLFYSLGFLTSGIWAVYIIKTKYKVNFQLLPFKIVKRYFKDSTQFFWSRLSSFGYSNTNTFLIGLILPSQYITYYYTADKIISTVLKIYNPIQQALYPYLVKVFNKKVFIYSSLLIFSTALIAMFSITIFDNFLSKLLLKEIVSSFIQPLNILAYLIPISVIYVMLGAPLLLAKGYIKEFNNSIIYGFGLHLVLLVIVYYISKYYIKVEDNVLVLFAYTLLLSKFSVLLLRSYYVLKKRIHKEILL
jgi:PST family polysaccharide transporter